MQRLPQEKNIFKLRGNSKCPICPVCGGIQPYLLIEKHVNFCLDLSSNVKDTLCDVVTKNEESFSSNLLSPKKRLSFFNGRKYSAINKVRKSRESSVFDGVPTHKIIEGTFFMVDAFNYGIRPECRGYFLTHFHSDHYNGISNLWVNSNSPIYASNLTCLLLKEFFGINAKALLIGEEYTIDGIVVQVYDANHCPGSLMISFTLPNNNCILHTGDFRASYELVNKINKVHWDTIYLDNTYASSTSNFMTQDDAISGAVCKLKKLVSQKKLCTSGDYLIIIGTYKIGKERLAIECAKSFKTTIFSSPKKLRVYSLMHEWADFQSLLSKDAISYKIHLVDMSIVDNYLDYWLQYKDHFKMGCIAINPTGWVGNVSIRHSGSCTYLRIPYSEHSSYSELLNFIQALKPGKIIPTVGPLCGYEIESHNAVEILSVCSKERVLN